MSDQPEPKTEESDEGQDEATEAKPMGLISYPAEPGKTQYGTYQNPNK